MRWKRARRSDNVVDARGSGRGMHVGGKGLSLGGISAQRVRWFKCGFEEGDLGRCDTFQSARL